MDAIANEQQRELARRTEFNQVFGRINDEELNCLTGCSRAVLYHVWSKYAFLQGSPIRNPCVCFLWSYRPFAPICIENIEQYSSFSDHVVHENKSSSKECMALASFWFQWLCTARQSQPVSNDQSTNHCTMSIDERSRYCLEWALGWWAHIAGVVSWQLSYYAWYFSNVRPTSIEVGIFTVARQPEVRRRCHEGSFDVLSVEFPHQIIFLFISGNLWTTILRGHVGSVDLTSAQFLTSSLADFFLHLSTHTNIVWQTLHIKKRSRRAVEVHVRLCSSR